jgi:hypothetical protein
MYRLQDDDPLKVWGLRAWTFPEVLLSKGDSVTVLNGYPSHQLFGRCS